MALRRVVEHVIGRDRRNASRSRQVREITQPDRIFRSPPDRQSQIGTVGENPFRPRKGGLGADVCPVRTQDRDEPVIPLFDIRPVEMTGSLAAAFFADAEQSAHSAIGCAIRRIEQ